MWYFPCSVHKNNSKSLQTVKIQFFLHIFVMYLDSSFICFQTCERIKIYIWLFLSNLAYVSILTLTCYTGVPTTLYRDTWLGKLYFSVLIICPFLFSICNMYTICLVSKFGFCFVEGMEVDMNNGLQNNDVHALQVNVF